MTYVEKMASKISIGMAFSSIKNGNPEGEEFINQIIADWKRVCLKSIEPFSRFAHMHYSAYVEAIEGAEAKEDKDDRN